MMGIHNGKLIVVSYPGSGTTLSYSICSDKTGDSGKWTAGSTTFDNDMTGFYFKEPVGNILSTDLEFKFTATKAGVFGIFALDITDFTPYKVSYYNNSPTISIMPSPSAPFPVYNNGVIYATGQGNSSTFAGHFSQDSVILYRERYNHLGIRINYDVFMEASSLLTTTSNIITVGSCWLWHRLITVKMTQEGANYYMYFCENANVAI
jgi:hypothetical protein